MKPLSECHKRGIPHTTWRKHVNTCDRMPDSQARLPVTPSLRINGEASPKTKYSFRFCMHYCASTLDEKSARDKTSAVLHATRRRIQFDRASPLCGVVLSIEWHVAPET